MEVGVLHCLPFPERQGKKDLMAKGQPFDIEDSQTRPSRDPNPKLVLEKGMLLLQLCNAALHVHMRTSV